MNSRTSLPLSPIRPMTFTFASVCRAIMPRSTLFPTPEPAKIPILCPFPQVRRPLMLLTPRSRGSRNTPFLHGVDGILVNGDRFAAVQRSLPVHRVAETIYDPAQDAVSHGGAHRLLLREYARTYADAPQVAERHEHGLPVPETDDFRVYGRRIVERVDQRRVTHGRQRAPAFDDKAHYLVYPAVYPVGIEMAELSRHFRQELFLTHDYRSARSLALRSGS